ncbi:MAG: hypothetical protein AB1757_07305 [Acidobacteriota bacterium]
MNLQNHCETQAKESLTDLPLTDEQAEATRAGELARHEGALMGNLFSSTPVAK